MTTEEGVLFKVKVEGRAEHHYQRKGLLDGGQLIGLAHLVKGGQKVAKGDQAGNEELLTAEDIDHLGGVADNGGHAQGPLLEDVRQLADDVQAVLLKQLLHGGLLGRGGE